MTESSNPPPSTTERTFAERGLLLLGSIGPIGHLPASGTVSVAVVGIPLYWVMSEWLRLTPMVYAAVTVAFSLLAIGVHHGGDKILGEADSRKLVWDELVGFMVAMFMVGWSWQAVLLGFFAERIIDIVKVPPANIIDKRMHNGLGVVLDDVVAGIYTCVLLHLLL